MIYTWSTLPTLATIYPFDPDLDVLHIDDPGLSAAALAITFDTSLALSITLESVSKQLTLGVDPTALAHTSITFADGSVLLVGDDTTGTSSDSADNTLIASPGDDRLYGLGGNDTLDGAAGNDVVYGGAGDDVLRDSNGSATDLDRLYGEEGDDVFLLGAGRYVVNGGGGDDYIDGLGAASFTIPPPDGWAPRVDYSDSTNPVYVNVSQSTLGAISYGDRMFMSVDPGQAFDGIGTANEHFGGRDTLLHIVEVDGGQGDDVFWGDGQSFNGGPGDDHVLSQFLGAEARYETATSFVVANLNEGAISAHGLTIAGWAAQDGEGGTDLLIGVNSLVGSGFDDFLFGSAADERFSGARGNDTIDGGGGLDYARYADVPYALGGVSVFLENGSGTANDGYGTTDSLTDIEGAIGTQRNDMLTGGAGDQHFFGRGGDDTLNGGAGSDWAHYSTDPWGVSVNLTSGRATDGWNGGAAPWTFGFGGIDRLVSIENVEGSLYADTIAGNADGNTLLGLAGDDTIEGRGGDDILRGGDGNDRLEGGAGNDQLIGGAGFDYAKYRYAPGAVVVELLNTGPTPADNNYAAGDTYDSIEGVIGSLYDDYISGDANANDLAGLDGDDGLLGLDGDDNLQGGAGDDYLAGGAGRDRLDGGTGDDLANYVRAPTAVVVNLTSPWQNTGEAQGDGYLSIENIQGSQYADMLVGNAGRNTLLGHYGDDTLEGRGGDDVLNGESGNDRLEGGFGADQLIGGDGFDYAKYRYAAAGVSADLAGLIDNAGDAGGDTYLGIEGLIGSAFADSLYGDDGMNDIAALDGNDVIFGRGGDDNLQGGNGNDILDGGANDPADAMNDRLVGEGGDDRFQFHRGEADGDVVVDFKGIVAGGGDTLQFFGYGENAVFNFVDATHYNITPDPTVGGPTETITFSNAPLIVDFVDVQYFL